MKRDERLNNVNVFERPNHGACPQRFDVALKGEARVITALENIGPPEGTLETHFKRVNVSEGRHPKA